MRILQLSSAQAFGGGERCLADLANAFTARGHNVFAAVRPGSPLISELRSLPEPNLITLPLRNSLDAKSAGRLMSFVRNKKIDIVHAHMARDYPLAAYAARRNRGTQFIVTRHVMFPLNRLHRITLSGVARVIGVSGAVVQQLRGEKLVAAEKISLVHNGIDVERFDAAIKYFNREEFCRKWNLPHRELLVGSVGALNPLKGHEDFLQAAAMISGAFPSAHFVVAGVDSSVTQENHANIERLTQDLNLKSRVSIIGRMDDIIPLYCALDVLVSASRTESFGLAIAEAMAARTPVVATETDGAREIIQHDESGLLVPLKSVTHLAESMKALLGDEKRRIQIGEQAHDRIRRYFSLDRMVDATERIYQESLG